MEKYLRKWPPSYRRGKKEWPPKKINAAKVCFAILRLAALILGVGGHSFFRACTVKRKEVSLEYV